METSALRVVSDPGGATETSIADHRHWRQQNTLSGLAPIDRIRVLNVEGANYILGLEKLDQEQKSYAQTSMTSTTRSRTYSEQARLTDSNCPPLSDAWGWVPWL